MTTAKPNFHKGYTLSSFYHNVGKFRSNALKLIPNPCVTGGNRYHIKSKKRLPLTALMLAMLGVNTAHAALSATTAQTIKGMAPYFTLGGVQLNNTTELLGFTYTDASGTAGTKATADDAVNNTTIIVDPNMKMSDIKAMVPITGASTTLSTILGADLDVADADDDTTSGTSAIGAMKAYWTKDGTANYIPVANEKFTACSTYSLTIAITDPATGAVASSAGNVEALTTYGDPNNQQYAYPAIAGSTPTTIYSATYTVKPKPGTPYACWAQPNLANGSGVYAGSPTQWNATKGFLPQTSPNKNFPTTGFYGAWFNLTVAGTTAESIIRKMDSLASGTPLTGHVMSSDGDITLQLVEASPNVVNITLFGPRDDTVTTQNKAKAPQRAFTPTAFTLKDASGANVYTFTIEKWFITKNVNIAFSSNATNWTGATISNPFGWDGTAYETPNYCANLGGTSNNYYKVPKRTDYTNSANAFIPEWNGTAGTGGYSTSTVIYYQREIDGGLFSEWGWLYKDVKSYPLSEFAPTPYYYWAREPSSETEIYLVSGYTGYVNYVVPRGECRAVCVSP